MARTSITHPARLTPRETLPLILSIWAGVFLIGLGFLGGSLAHASAALVRIGTSGDYAPFSLRHENDPINGYEGLDPSLARAFAKDRGLEIEFVPFRWPDLLKDLAAGRFDVAMSGITVRPERSVAGRFSLPITTSGAVLLVPDASPFVAIRELDQAEFEIAVNAGGHLERVTRNHFRRAQIRPMQDNQRVIHALAQGEVDAAMTDSREAVLWQEENPGLRAIGPFTRDRKAFLVAADQPELARELDAWLLESQADGRLDALRAKALGEPSKTTTTTKPLWALLAAVDERLSLMPWVAEAKRAGGGPIEVPSVEARVLEEAIIRFRAAREENPGPVKRNESRVLDFYRAQIEAAKSIQRQTLSAPSAQGNEPIPDLATALRPALLRINDRIATLLVALPAEVSESEILEATRQELISTNLPDRDRASLAAALIALTSPGPIP